MQVTQEDMDRIRGFYMLNGQQVILPHTYNCGFESPNWEPEAFIGRFSDCGPVPAVDLEDPNNNDGLYLTVAIPPLQFNRYAHYYPGGREFRTWQTLKTVATDIWLMAELEDPESEIFCVGKSVNTCLIFGKLLKNNIIYKMCNDAFIQISAMLVKSEQP